MRRLPEIAIAGLAVLGADACHRAEPEAPRASPGSGSANAQAVRLTDRERAVHFEECWSARNAARWDDVAACYAGASTLEVPGTDQLVTRTRDSIVAAIRAEGEKPTTLDLVLVSSGSIAALAHRGAEHLAQLIHTDDRGRIVNEWDFFDGAEPASAADQKDPETELHVAGEDTAHEATNTQTIAHAVEAFDGRDHAALASQLADDLSWSDAALGIDSDKDGVLAVASELWKGYSDLGLAVATTFAAGDRVAVIGILDGTNNGVVPALNLWNTGRKLEVPFLAVFQLADGKISKATVVYQRAAGSAAHPS